MRRRRGYGEKARPRSRHVQSNGTAPTGGRSHYGLTIAISAGVSVPSGSSRSVPPVHPQGTAFCPVAPLAVVTPPLICSQAMVVATMIRADFIGPEMNMHGYIPPSPASDPSPGGQSGSEMDA